MAYTPAGIYVFGSGTAPVLPVGVNYQRLRHSDGTTTLTDILSVDLYQGKLYASARFADGHIFHFYDGDRVTDWFDGRARATFTITGGGTSPAVAATGTFEIVGGTVGDQITSIKIDGVELLGAAVTHTGNNGTTAAAVATEIDAHLSTPDYLGDSNGQLVTITAATPGTAPNGKSIIVTATPGITDGSSSIMHGGSGTSASQITDIKVAGLSVINAPVSWVNSNEDTATAVVAAINGYTSTPDYVASSSGASVSIAAAVPGKAYNDFLVQIFPVGGLTYSMDNPKLADGADSTNTYQPGDFVKTIGQKEYATTGSEMHFSGINAPKKWTTATVGAGFIDMSSESSGSEVLTALARYQNLVAVFAERVVQIWYTDPDPKLNRQQQVLNNTGTTAPRSVTQFGDTDIFYLDYSGVRSLRARYNTTSASTADIGVPVDSLIVAKFATLNADEVRLVTGLIEPVSGRFWLLIKDQVFVFSFFSGANVSAWSSYDLSYVDNSGNTVTFEIDTALVYNRRVYVRSGDQIFVYGGLATGDDHDETEAEAWLPFLDADDPTRKKQFRAVDAAIRGNWTVSAAMDPTNDIAEDKVGVLTETTYNIDGRVPLNHVATHVSLRFRSNGVGPHKLGACVVTYDKTPDED